MEGTVKAIVEVVWPVIEKEVKLHLNSHEEAVKMESNLKKIKEVVDVAEKVWRMMDPELKRRMKRLQDIAYDMEDALDDWNMPQDHQGPGEPPASDWTASFWKTCCAIVHYPCDIMSKSLAKRRVAGLINGLNEALGPNYDNVRDELKNMQISQVSNHRERSNSIIVESLFHGRKSDKYMIKKMLIEDSNPIGEDMNNGIPFDVVAIVGKGGLGKTSLAQIVYNDATIITKFETRIWVCVSDSFDEIEIANEILQNLERRKPQVSAPNLIAESIKGYLEGKEFLLVLDDVWVEDHTKWNKMKAYLSSGAPGSKILMTTRKEKSANSIFGSTEARIHSKTKLVGQ